MHITHAQDFRYKYIHIYICVLFYYLLNTVTSNQYHINISNYSIKSMLQENKCHMFFFLICPFKGMLLISSQNQFSSWKFKNCTINATGGRKNVNA